MSWWPPRERALAFAGGFGAFFGREQESILLLFPHPPPQFHHHEQSRRRFNQTRVPF